MTALLVIAPHPDDELLGAGAIMARAHAAGVRVGVVILTDGSQSDPGVEPATLTIKRQQETRAGLDCLLGVSPPLLFLDQPDGALDATEIDLFDDNPLNKFVADLSPTTILVTDPADAHPDHKAAFGLATRLISAGAGRLLQVMPVSQRVDGVFDPQGYDPHPVGDLAEAKNAALDCHSSQIDSTTGFALSDPVRADFARTEYLRTAYDRDDTSTDAIAADHFDAMFDHRHAVTLTPGGTLATALGTTELTVNSVHYQGVDRVGADLAVEAIAADGQVEALSGHSGRAPLLAVQWHPEWATEAHADRQSFFHLLGRALRGQSLQEPTP